MATQVIAPVSLLHFPIFIMGTTNEKLTPQAHTPGPWRINEYRDCITDGNRVLAEKPHGEALHWDANARLMAKAPELLDALKAIVDAAEDDMVHTLDCQEPESCTLCTARKVIAEAEAQ